ncbi:hypothetical protein FBU30_005393 [Linnemannia zychae]|nr:hypothetical protein FBU30_005393 [Linnemannia zychae]
MTRHTSDPTKRDARRQPADNNQEATALFSQTLLRQPSTRRPHSLNDYNQKQHPTSTAPEPIAPRDVQNLPNINNNSNGSIIEPAMLGSCGSLPMPLKHRLDSVSSEEGRQYPTLVDIQQRSQQQPKQQQQQQRRQLPFNSVPSVRTRQRTNSASSTATTSLTGLRTAAAAFIATMHQNHFQFPHKVLYPEVQTFSATHRDLQCDFSESDGERVKDSFASHELEIRSNNIQAKAVRNAVKYDHRQMLMGETDTEIEMDNNDDGAGQLMHKGRGQNSTPPLVLNLNNDINNEELFWRLPQYDPILFPSSATDATIDAIASSDAPLFPLSSYRRSSSLISQLKNSKPRPYQSIEKKEVNGTGQGLISSVQDHRPSIDLHDNDRLYHHHRQQGQYQHLQQDFSSEQNDIIDDAVAQNRSTSPIDKYAYQQEILTDDPTSPLPPLYFHSARDTPSVPSNQQHLRHQTVDNGSEFSDNTDRGSWVSELSSSPGILEHRAIQQPLHEHPKLHLFSAVDGRNRSDPDLMQKDSRSEQDREVFEVCSRRNQPGYTPSQNIHKALVSSIRSSFLASLNDSQRASLMDSNDSFGMIPKQQSSPECEVDTELYDFQQPWYQPQLRPIHHASPNQEYMSASDSFEREDERRHQGREEELLGVIAQLENDLQSLQNSRAELHAKLCDSEEHNERMLFDHDCELRRIKEEHDFQMKDTKKRTKRFYDETMRKRKRDEEKRLEGLKEQLTHAQTENKELRIAIRGLQRERLDAEQDQRDDFAIISRFIEEMLSPVVHNLTVRNIEPLQTVGHNKHCRWPFSIGDSADPVINQHDDDPFASATKVAEEVAQSNPEIPFSFPAGIVYMQYESAKTLQEPHDDSTTASSPERQNKWKEDNRLYARTKDSEAQRFEYLNSRRARKRHSDSSNASSGKTVVTPLSQQLSDQKEGISQHVIHPPTTDSTLKTHPSIYESEKSPGFTIPTTDRLSTTTTAVSSPQKHYTSTNLSSPTPSMTTNTTLATAAKEKDYDTKSLQHCLAEQHARYQKEIERIKQQCIRIYRQSLEEVRAEMKSKLDQRRRASSAVATTKATIPSRALAMAAAH